MEQSETIKQSFRSEQITLNNYLFPRFFSPVQDLKSNVCLQGYFIKNSKTIISQLKKHGSLVFRDFDIKSPNEAVSLLKKLGFQDSINIKKENHLQLVVGTKNQDYLNNTQSLSMFNCPKISKSQRNNIHNQCFRLSEFGQFVSLFCSRPAVKGGNILLSQLSQIYSYVQQKHSQLLKQIDKKGICEIQILSENQNPQLNVRNGWKNSFQVANKEEAQKFFKQKNIQFEWLDNDQNQCKIKRKVRSQSFQQSKQQFNSQLNQILYFYKLSKDKNKKISQFLTFGDGSQFPQQTIEDIYNFKQKYTANIQLKAGDFILFDTKLVDFTQQPYQCPLQVPKVFMSFLNISKKSISPQIIQTLNSGYKMPLIGFGTWKIPLQDACQVVYNAIKSGYRLIDCAAVYQNQTQVGKGINKALKQNIVKRQDLFVTSKLWNTYHRPQHVRAACERTLKDLGLEYLDLYLMHFPVSLKFIPFEQRYPGQWIHDPKSQKPYMIEQKVPLTYTWKAMQDLVDAKLVRNIGVSNFTVALLRQIIYSCQLKPSVLQIQLHPQLSQQKFVRFARQQGVQVTSYSSFGASSYVNVQQAKQDQLITNNPTVKQIAKKHDKTPHQVVLRWVVQRGIAIIPKSVKIERSKQNLAVSQFSLTGQEMKMMSKLNKNKRYNDPGDFCQTYFGSFYPLHE